MTKPSSAMIFSLLLSSVLCTPGFAVAPSFQSAVADYNAKKYTVAVNEFKQFEASYPKNAMSHYYLALCYQSLGDRTNARQQFILTNQYGDATLKGYAQKALVSLGGSNSGGTDAVPQLAAGLPGHGGGANVSAQPSQVSEVLEFYTDWCHVCKEFAPVWSQTQSKVSGVSFHSYNAEESSNASLVQKYHVSAYPTLVYLDRSGRELKNMAGSWNSANDFAESIRETH